MRTLVREDDFAAYMNALLRSSAKRVPSQTAVTDTDRAAVSADAGKAHQFVLARSRPVCRELTMPPPIINLHAALLLSHLIEGGEDLARNMLIAVATSPVLASWRRDGSL